MYECFKGQINASGPDALAKYTFLIDFDLYVLQANRLRIVYSCSVFRIRTLYVLRFCGILKNLQVIPYHESVQLSIFSLTEKFLACAV